MQLQYEQARGESERARTAITARQSTVEAAQRVHDLTVLRYDQGLATQLEVCEARLSLLQARTNLAQAIADFLIADASGLRSVGGTTAMDARPAGRRASAGHHALHPRPGASRSPATAPATTTTTTP